MSLAMAFAAADHDVVAVVGRTAESAKRGAALVGSTSTALTLDEGVPPADLLVIAVRDGLMTSIAGALAERRPEVGAAIHVSGLTSVDALAPLAAIGISTGSFHPLQTLPTPEAGAARLRGAHIAVTADLPFRESGTLLVRASDNTSEVQPREMTWNLKGYMNNSWHSVPLQIGHDS